MGVAPGDGFPGGGVEDALYGAAEHDSILRASGPGKCADCRRPAPTMGAVRGPGPRRRPRVRGRLRGLHRLRLRPPAADGAAACGRRGRLRRRLPRGPRELPGRAPLLPQRPVPRGPVRLRGVPIPRARTRRRSSTSRTAITVRAGATCIATTRSIARAWRRSSAPSRAPRRAPRRGRSDAADAHRGRAPRRAAARAGGRAVRSQPDEGPGAAEVTRPLPAARGRSSCPRSS